MRKRVLVVDDSSFFRRRVSEIINSDPRLEVIDTANNGQQAIEKALSLKPDVITMDVEMPVLDGISAVRRIMQRCPTPILMFSSLTHDGARATLDALEAGALDFLPKKFEDIARDREEAKTLLTTRIRHIANRRMSPAKTASISPTRSSEVKPDSVSPAFLPKRIKSQRARLLAIGTSTGGPVALQAILKALPANFPAPIILVQHMPAAFTGAFAARLNSQCLIQVKEAENGDILRPGCAYLAPGGKQMLLDGGSAQVKLIIRDDQSERLTYKPSVDVTFATAAKTFQKQVLAVILTGMGADGREGCRMLKSQGAEVLAQDQASCVVYGMPQAVVSAGIAKETVPLNRMADRIMQAFYD
ncbi:protein-glutamate methylesterase/protein-glutamine glutaminase [Gayadomonas joobiniege]|uniref:protein-glutamate methylesterase/protein-glutamine glutaminase n=1 Tax=Gayadomonas joobiniege TaxID=1234606 RepID=UPI00047474B4|nr:chemotaxis response regulator protein-glutamate methylesterase [Gayadomonas joobiniege]